MSNEQESKEVSFLIVTANVGTLFEDLSGLQDVWLNEFMKVVEAHQPSFIALHFQEVGGKDCKSSMSHVDGFITKLLSLSGLGEFTTVQGYLDEDFASIDQYTALGNFYFVRKSLTDAALWNYDKCEFDTVSGKNVHSKDLSNRTDICKEKFEQGYFPDCKWSRKGYTRVRWKICNKILEFVNIHLFHDDNNLVALQSSPSCYSKSRKRALKFVLQRIHSDSPPDSKFFIFGDFNFRLDIKSLVQKLCGSCNMQVIRSQDEDSVRRLLYRSVNGEGTDEVLLQIEKKAFQCDQSLLRKNGNYEHLRPFNGEPEDLSDELREFCFKFNPTYPYSEKATEGNEYMSTRCPAWCDRVLLSSSAYDWVNTKALDVKYDTIGKDVCMGDHKPIFLSFTLKMNSSETDSPTNGSSPVIFNGSAYETTVQEPQINLST